MVTRSELASRERCRLAGLGGGPKLAVNTAMPMEFQGSGRRQFLKRAAEMMGFANSSAQSAIRVEQAEIDRTNDELPITQGRALSTARTADWTFFLIHVLLPMVVPPSAYPDRVRRALPLGG
jgi:hypothetical protein